MKTLFANIILSGIVLITAKESFAAQPFPLVFNCKDSNNMELALYSRNPFDEKERSILIKQTHEKEADFSYYVIFKGQERVTLHLYSPVHGTATTIISAIYKDGKLIGNGQGLTNANCLFTGEEK